MELFEAPLLHVSLAARLSPTLLWIVAREDINIGIVLGQGFSSSSFHIRANRTTDEAAVNPMGKCTNETGAALSTAAAMDYYESGTG